MTAIEQWEGGRAPVIPPVGRVAGLRSWVPPLAPLLLVAGLLVFGPMAWGIAPDYQELTARLQGPSWEHPLGTDHLGRDVLSRVLNGGRLSLGISLIAVAISGSIGVALGVVSGLARGVVDVIVMRVTDVLISVPFLLLALTVAGLSGGGVRGLVLALALFGWTNYARVARAETLRLRGTPMMEAANAVGATQLRMVFVHMLPNMAAPLLVLAVVRFANTVLTIAGLSFLGVGVQPPTPEWGAMLSEGMRFIERAPHVLLAPGAAITLSCLLVTVSADGLRRRFDPRGR